MKPAAIALFERIPDRLFSPLGSENRRGYWSLLCALHRYRFGPDAPMPPSHGFLLRDINKDIEDHIKYDSAWESEDGETPDTPLNIRAIGIFNRLQDAGWFKTERWGMERTVVMRPAVSQFLTMLIGFAETGPVFVSGKIRSIDANLTVVAKGEGGGDVLREAADQARHLLEHIRNTGTNVRDLMGSLDPDSSTAQYVRTFFRDYIEQVFIGDYRELRTREHPLSRRPQILRTVEHISTNEAERARLIDWYEQRPAGGNRQKAEALFERDLQRLRELHRIDEYLDRLDDEIRRANKRALAFLDYRLRSLRPLDDLIHLSIQRLVTSNAAEPPPIFGADVLMSGDRLAEPRRVVERPAPSALRQQTISDYEKARARLMLRAREARSMTAPKLAAYVSQALADKDTVNGNALPLTTNGQLRAFQVLQSVAMAMDSGSVRLASDARRLAHGFDVRNEGNEERDHPYLSGRPFAIVRRRRQPDNLKSDKE
ncbi:MAG: DUF5716 family protein [Azonexus sp.]|nr:DUF5716 family protein [Azonexus sp.]